MAVVRRLVTVSVAVFCWSLTGQRVCGYGQTSSPTVNTGLSSWTSTNNATTIGKGVTLAGAAYGQVRGQEPVDCPFCFTSPRIGKKSGLYIPTCVFPFVWKNVTYHTCTRQDRSQDWCATMVTEHLEPIASMYCFIDPFFETYPLQTPPTLPAGPQKGKCLFPFAYYDIVFSTCTNDHTPPWCPVMLSYSHEPLLSKYCEEEKPTTSPPQNTTVSGEEVHRGPPPRLDPGMLASKCSFPFRWKGIRYEDCTTADRELPWCAVEVEEGTYQPLLSMYCSYNWVHDPYLTLLSPTVQPGSGRKIPTKQCKFPFMWKGIEYEACTSTEAKKPWCPIRVTKSNEPIESAYCEDLFKGNAPSEPPPTVPKVTMSDLPCVFPFVYHGVTYHKCASEGAAFPWCPTNITAKGFPLQSDYCKHEIDKKRSLPYVGPPSITAKNPRTCIFPFTWKGKKYSSCTTVDRNLPWCAVDLDIPSNQPVSSIYCNYNWESHPYPAIMSPTVPAGNTTSVSSQSCIFPFKWKNHNYTNCTTADAKGPWCPIELDAAGKRPRVSAYCADQLTGPVPDVPPPTIYSVTQNDELCIFPFVYKGVTYHRCAIDDAYERWCPTRVTVEGFPIKTQYCRNNRNGNRPSRVPTPTFSGSKETLKCTLPFKYEGHTYDSCTRNYSSFPWCAGHVDEKGEAKNVIPCTIAP